MGKELKMFFLSFSNGFRADGYNSVVTKPKRMGQITKEMDKKRERNYKRIKKVIDERIYSIGSY